MEQLKEGDPLGYNLQNRLLAKGLKIDLIDLMHQPLPIFCQRDGDESNVETIRQSFAKSNTPEYHRSFSGALKNALEYY